MTDLDLTRYLRPGDRVVWGQGPAEPTTLVELLVAQPAPLGHQQLTTLVELLVAQRGRLGGVTCFIGLPGLDVIRSEHARELTFQSYCGTGSNQRLPGDRKSVV